MLSGVFAKYVSQDNVGYQIKLKKFGITLTLDPSALENAGATVTTPVDTNKEVSILIDNLQLVPGDILDDALRIKVRSEEHTSELQSPS